MKDDMYSIKIAIIGGGVIGLTTAVCLFNAGYKNITIYADKISPNTTSDVAAAIWVPYKVEPEELTFEWCKVSLQAFVQLMQSPYTGVRWIDCTEYYKSAPAKQNWMSLVQKASSPYPLKDFPQHLSNRLPFMDTSIYMKYLHDKFIELGGNLLISKINNFDELKRIGCGKIINCSGLGSRELAKDDSLVPGRGQIILMTNPNKLTYSVADPRDESLTYVVPRTNDIVVGGSYELNNWNLNSDSRLTEEILLRARSICPLLIQSEIIDVKVGLRPIRPCVRVEKDPIDSNIIHNYGHGGAGFTLSWGCAQEVVNLISMRKEPDAASFNFKSKL
jgi:D-amino-acid oxidase